MTLYGLYEEAVRGTEKQTFDSPPHLIFAKDRVGLYGVCFLRSDNNERKVKGAKTLVEGATILERP